MEQPTRRLKRPELIAVPNVSEGREPLVIEALKSSIQDAGAEVLDVHSDVIHNRSVFTVVAPPAELAEAMVSLAVGARDRIDLARHGGVHPRLGALDVCPFVPVSARLDLAVAVAGRAGAAIGDLGIPVYLYGAAATRPEFAELPALRGAGRAGLTEMLELWPPDHGPARVDERTGVTCVGARGPLIAFNVWLRCEQADAAAIADTIRGSSGGMPGVRALGFGIEPGRSQVSMNLTQPAVTGIDAAFLAVRRLAEEVGIAVEGAEIVGLVAERFLPQERETARLLFQPGRSLESALAR